MTNHANEYSGFRVVRLSQNRVNLDTSKYRMLLVRNAVKFSLCNFTAMKYSPLM